MTANVNEHDVRINLKSKFKSTFEIIINSKTKNKALKYPVQFSKLDFSSYDLNRDCWLSFRTNASVKTIAVLDFDNNYHYIDFNKSPLRSRFRLVENWIYSDQLYRFESYYFFSLVYHLHPGG